MPNRMLKESIKLSPEIDQLSWFEEVLFYRMIVSADDYGCLDGRAAVLKNTLFPTKENITKKAINDGIAKLLKVGLVETYAVSERPYIHLLTFESHQRLRNKNRKFPEPPSAKKEPKSDLTDNCLTNDGQLTDNCLLELEEELELEEKRTRTSLCSERSSVEDAHEPYADTEPLPLNDGTEWTPTASQFGEYQRLYPAVDVRRAFADMRGWCNANPQKRKTRRGINRFVNSWLSREQDKYHPGTTVKKKGFDIF